MSRLLLVLHKFFLCERWVINQTLLFCSFSLTLLKSLPNKTRLARDRDSVIITEQKSMVNFSLSSWSYLLIVFVVWGAWLLCRAGCRFILVISFLNSCIWIVVGRLKRVLREEKLVGFLYCEDTLHGCVLFYLSIFECPLTFCLL